ncbi:unnamed protein product [Trichogramma brassicae]|uniref:RNA-directed DNA polymerase n=1 Tax=Trichogramma brassicae TaxID=86971 RepID=A0A6H5J0P5_9HYME|nr:unnamed protein product [Trichogramma brassicae]
MQQWDFEVVHRKGKYNELPDALSRVCEIEPDDGEVENANVCTINVCDIDDEAYTARIKEVAASPERWRNWCVRNGMLYRYKYDAILDPVSNESAGWKLVVPKNHRERVLREAHSDISSGHLGVEKTYERVAREYFWRGMYHDVHEFVRISRADGATRAHGEARVRRAVDSRRDGLYGVPEKQGAEQVSDCGNRSVHALCRRRLEEKLANGYVPQCQAPKKKEKREIRHGVFFGELARVAIDDSIDPPDGTCFRCWQPGHRSVDCRGGLDEHFCGNCGRSGRYTVDCERCGARARLMLGRCYLPNAVTRGMSGWSNECWDQHEGESRRAASDHSQAWAVTTVEERRAPPAAAQGPPAASWQREPRQQPVRPEQYRAPQLSELEMYHRVMERQAQIEAGRAECQRALQEAYAIEMIRVRAFGGTGPYRQWEGPPHDRR